jgi:hypothetical protein
LTKKLCACGCQQETEFATRTNIKKGIIKGITPNMYIKNHHVSEFPSYNGVNERFWSQVDIQSPNICWVWVGKKAPGKYNYGRFGNKHSASRFSWELANGAIPDGMFVLHKCDNPPCVNPNHLFLGTQQDNMDDMKNKGRRASFRGDLCGMSKLTWQDAENIRSLGKTQTLAQITTQYKTVAKTTIWSILHNKSWSAHNAR